MLLKIVYTAVIFSFSIVNSLSVLQIKPYVGCIVSAGIKDYKLIASLPDENIQLFGYGEISPEKSNYESLLLKTNGKIIHLNWTNLNLPGFEPKLTVSDINNDAIKELVIILIKSSGTELHEEEIHVLNLSTLNEIPIVDPLYIIKEKVNTSIVKKNSDKVIITVEVNNTKTEIIKDENYSPFWFPNIDFGNVIVWRVINNKLYADIGAQITPASFVGTITIEYKFKENMFNMKNINFIANK